MPHTHAKAEILGYLGRDPEYKVTNAGVQLVELSVATRRHRRRNGQFEEITQWHRAVAYSNLAEEVQRSFRKGDLIQLDGNLDEDEWIDKETQQKRTRPVIRISRCTMIDPRPQDSGAIESDPGRYAQSSSRS